MNATGERVVGNQFVEISASINFSVIKFDIVACFSILILDFLFFLQWFFKNNGY